MFDAERFKTRLHDLGLSQGALARAIGVSQQTISRLASGERYGSRHLHLIARELHTTPAYLTGEVDDPDLDAPEPPVLTAGEVAWVEIYRALDERSRSALMHIAQTMLTGTNQPVVNVPKGE